MKYLDTAILNFVLYQYRINEKLQSYDNIIYPYSILIYTIIDLPVCKIRYQKLMIFCTSKRAETLSTIQYREMY